MLNKKLNQALLLCLMFTGASMTASAGHDRYEDRARVTSVTPQVERINTPVQECRTEYVRESYYEDARPSNGGAIIGTIAGGLIGSRFGGGNGRLITTAVGAGLGAVIGDRHDNRYSARREHVAERPVERCVTVDRWETVTTGYLVDYKYNGRHYTTVTQERPGKFIPVNVSVRPSGYVTNVEYRYDHDHDRYRDYDDRKRYKRHY
jgi:uncharacterized protein YcfJ